MLMVWTPKKSKGELWRWEKLLTHPKHAAGTAGVVEPGWEAWSCVKRGLLLVMPELMKRLEDA